MVLANYAASLPLFTHTCPLGILNFQQNSGPWRKRSQLTAVFVGHVKDIKRNINSGDYVPHWTLQNQENIHKCILPHCNKTESIVHSGLVTAKHINDIFNVAVNTDDGKLVPLCQVHYKQVHRTINPQVYMHEKCFTCSASIKGSCRHCPNTVAIKNHFCQVSDMDLNITENDKICTSCYNSHLQIIANLK